jgi:hypothetical protein
MGVVADEVFIDGTGTVGVVNDDDAADDDDDDDNGNSGNGGSNDTIDTLIVGVAKRYDYDADPENDSHAESQLATGAQSPSALTNAFADGTGRVGVVGDDDDDDDGDDVVNEFDVSVSVAAAAKLKAVQRMGDVDIVGVNGGDDDDEDYYGRSVTATPLPLGDTADDQKRLVSSVFEDGAGLAGADRTLIDSSSDDDGGDDDGGDDDDDGIYLGAGVIGASEYAGVQGGMASALAAAFANVPAA